MGGCCPGTGCSVTKTPLVAADGACGICTAEIRRKGDGSADDIGGDGCLGGIRSWLGKRER